MGNTIESAKSVQAAPPAEYSSIKKNTSAAPAAEKQPVFINRTDGFAMSLGYESFKPSDTLPLTGFTFFAGPRFATSRSDQEFGGISTSGIYFERLQGAAFEPVDTEMMNSTCFEAYGSAGSQLYYQNPRKETITGFGVEQSIQFFIKPEEGNFRFSLGIDDRIGFVINDERELSGSIALGSVAEATTEIKNMDVSANIGIWHRRDVPVGGPVRPTNSGIALIAGITVTPNQEPKSWPIENKSNADSSQTEGATASTSPKTIPTELEKLGYAVPAATNVDAVNDQAPPTARLDPIQFNMSRPNAGDLIKLETIAKTRALTLADFMALGIFNDPAKAEPHLQTLANALITDFTNNADRKLTIAGHTSQDGTEAFNLHISQNRIAVIKMALVALGVPENRIELEACGESRPLAEESRYADNPRQLLNARTTNRRVEFTYNE